MEQIRSTEIGAKLLRAIEGAGSEMLIVKAGQNQDNTCVQSSQSEQASNAACYREVLKFDILKTKNSGSDQQEHDPAGASSHRQVHEVPFRPQQHENFAG